MKKAYVKPVFLAEEFSGTANVASCAYGATQSELQVWKGSSLCKVGDGGHTVGKKNYDAANWWEYATETAGANKNPPTSASLNGYNNGAYLFTDGQYVCDFVWSDSDAQVGIWTSKANDTTSAISSEADRKNGILNTNLFVTFISSFSKFFGIEPDNENHVPGIDNKAFFS